MMIKAKPGFQIEVDRQLIEEAKLDTIPDYIIIRSMFALCLMKLKLKKG